MAYYKKSRTYNIKKSVLLIIGFAFSIFIIFLGYFLYLNMTVSGKAATEGNGTIIAKEKTMNILRAKCSMGPGEILDMSKVELIEVPVDLVPANAIVSISGIKNTRLRRAIVEKEFIKSGDLMPENAWFEDGDRLIEHNFAEGAIPASAAGGSIIDIKLFKAGEEDKVVISKATVISRNGNLLSFYLNPVEQEYLKESASEGMLFAVQYIDESQNTSGVTYIPAYEHGKRERK
ncbi:MAG: hypothetical protein ACM3TR_01730 [Caulobacteraceae bacterium]